MFELVFLGTSASAPSVTRNLSSALVTHEGKRFLVDCGEGTQRQILRSGLGFRNLSTFLFTHGHLDHILGLGGLVSTFGRWELVPELRIYASQFALERIEALMEVVQKGKAVPKLTYVEVNPGTIFQDEKMEIEAFPVSHRGGGCFGYIFREREKRPFLVEEAEKLGVPAGPERRRLVQGEAVTLADGRAIRPEQVLGKPAPGTTLAYVGDAGRTKGLAEAAKGADCLVCEATYISAHQELARHFDHLTAAQAARVAKEAGVKLLIVSHISRRYSGLEVLSEARKIFPNTLLAEDLDCYQIARKGSVLLEKGARLPAVTEPQPGDEE